MQPQEEEESLLLQVGLQMQQARLLSLANGLKHQVERILQK
jgi:hypothetical protein